ncbi:MAG TPA: peptidylprolyl isomerase, partial [Pirellulaceae bacterium]|nr:peptidylprolyl isomerase [Pirellulaceae bacterium]
MPRNMPRLLILPLLVCGMSCAGCSTTWPWRRGGDAIVAQKPLPPPVRSAQDFSNPGGPGPVTRNDAVASNGSVSGGTAAPASQGYPGAPTSYTPVPGTMPFSHEANSGAGVDGDRSATRNVASGATAPTHFTSTDDAATGQGGAATKRQLAPPAPLPANAIEIKAASTVAKVGPEHILAGDIDGMVNVILAVKMAAVPPDQLEQMKDAIEQQKQILFRNLLQMEIQTKLGYLDFVKTVPKDKLPDLQKRVNESFEKDLEATRTKLASSKDEQELEDLERRDPILVRLATLMKLHQIETLGGLDAQLRRYGSTLEKQQRAYGEQKLSQMAIFRNIKQNPEITHEEMLKYYREHHDEYAIPAKAKWEQLTVRFDKFPDEQAATAALAAMGNEVYLGGAAFAAVAKRGSQEPQAEQGGQHDWTNKGSLASTALDEAIFSLPLNRLSQMIRDERGMHIVRVLERT